MTKTNPQWTRKDIPDLTNKVVVVTGANSGLGLQYSIDLANNGAKVYMVCRSNQRGTKALQVVQEQLKEEKYKKNVFLELCDLGSIESIQSFAKNFTKENRIDILCNNAGIMATPFALSKDGIEKQFAVNHIGHFVLTKLLLSKLLNSKSPRIVNVSSNYHKLGNQTLSEKKLSNDFLNNEGSYDQWEAYGRTKFANLLFTKELNKRYPKILSVSAHPGFTGTNLGEGMQSNFLVKWMFGLGTKLMSQSVEMGVLPQVLASVDEGAVVDDFYGPENVMYGYPVKGKVEKSKQEEYNDKEVGERLWKRSEELSGIIFN